MSDPGEEAPALFRASMAVVFCGTVVNVLSTVVMTPAVVGKWAGNAIVGWAAPKYSIFVLVYLKGAERAISWFQELPPGYFYVLAHGCDGGPLEEQPDGTFHYIGLDNLAAAITQNRHYATGRPVVLISCQVGAGAFPRQLSDKIGADVYASPDYVNAGLMTTPGGVTFPRLNWRVWRKH